MENSGYTYRGNESPNLTAGDLSVCSDAEIATEGREVP